ncbi:MAG: PAC2 family protein [Candidatus Omnitrophota bacterium]
MIKEIATPKLKEPFFIAVWPGMGEVAYRIGLFLREVLGFKMFAKLEAGDFFKPAAVVVENGVLEFPSMPAGLFYYAKAKGMPDIILFLGEAQPPLEHAQALSETIINFVKKYNAKFIFTFAAKPEPIDHKAEPAVWIAATHKDVLGDFKDFELRAVSDGQISGLNGIILGLAKHKKLPGACLLGEIPFYTVQIENPKASTNVLKVLDKHLNLKLNFSPLIEKAKFFEEEIDKLISYLKGDAPQQGPIPLSDEDIARIKKDLSAYTKLPQSAREKIEKFFEASRSDITFASKLKEELDRWNVYKEYEDRFLDLFKKKGNLDESN